MSWITGATGLAPLAFAGAFAMTLGAAAVRGFAGFGMAIILVPLFGMIMRPDDAVVLAILLQLLIGPVGMGGIVRDADRVTAIPIALVAVITTWFGIKVLAHTAPDAARVAIAAIAIAAFLLILIPAKPGHRHGLPVTLATGAAAGFLTGFAAMPGPPVVPFYARGGFAPQVARASMMLVFFATAIMGTMSAWLHGMIQVQTILASLLLFPAVLLGNWAGGLAFGKVPAPVWRSGVGLVLGVAGASAVFRLMG